MAYDVPFGLTQTVAPTVEPITVADVRTWGQFSGTTQDLSDKVLLERIKSAREQCETVSGLVFISTTFAMKLDCFPDEIQLPKPPWISLTSITYVDTAGATQTLASTVYRFDSAQGRISLEWGQVWPITLAVNNAVTVTFVSGFGTAASDLPARVRECVLATVQDRLEQHRLVFQLPPGVKEELKSLWSGRI